MSVSSLIRLPAQSGGAFSIAAGQVLEIITPYAQQVADLIAFTADDRGEYFSPGRTLDYNERLFITTNDSLYSNRSRKLLTIVRDDVRKHDYLLSPCSQRMFEVLRKASHHPSCHSNLARALQPFGVSADDIDATFNVFMNVAIAEDGKIEVRPPKSKAGDSIVLRAEVDLLVGITACSSEHTNAGVCKPIDYRIDSGVPLVIHGDEWNATLSGDAAS